MVKIPLSGALLNPFEGYSVVRFAILLELDLKPLDSGAELNSAPELTDFGANSSRIANRCSKYL